MKLWKVAVLVGGFLLLLLASAWLYYGGGDDDDHAVVGYVHGKVEEDNFDAWSLVVSDTTVYLRGRYDCGGVMFHSEDMLIKLEGETVTIGYSEDLGYPVAEEIEINGTRCIRVPGRGGHEQR